MLSGLAYRIQALFKEIPDVERYNNYRNIHQILISG
jgi:hypothetical protein